MQNEARPLVGVGVMFLRDQKVFLAKRQGSHGDSHWGWAGGHLEHGESFEDCARREAMEELGVVVGGLRFLCVSNVIAYGRHFVDIEFVGEIGDQEPKIAEPDAFSESGWFDMNDLPKPIFKAAEYAIEALRNGQMYFSGEPQN